MDTPSTHDEQRLERLANDLAQIAIDRELRIPFRPSAIGLMAAAARGSFPTMDDQARMVELVRMTAAEHALATDFTAGTSHQTIFTQAVVTVVIRRLEAMAAETRALTPSS